MTTAVQTSQCITEQRSMQEPDSILSLTRQLLHLLPPNMRRRYVLLLVCSIIVTFMESVGLGLMAVFASSISNAETILQSSAFVRLSGYFPFLVGFSERDLILTLGLLVVALMLIKTAGRAAVQYAHLQFTALASGLISDKMLTGFVQMPYNWLIRKNSADLLSTVAWASNGGSMLGCAHTAVTEGAMIFMLLVALLLANPVVILGILLFIGAPAYALLRGMRSRIDQNANALAEHRRIGSKHLHMTLQGVKEVKIYGQEEAFCNKYRLSAYAIPQHIAVQDFYSNLPGWILECAGFIVLCLATFTMLFLFGESSAHTTATLALVAVTAWRVLPAVVRVVGNINKFREFLPYIRDTLDHMDSIGKLSQPKPTNAHRSQKIAMNEGLSFESVSFRYETGGRTILHDLCFHLRKGESLGIVGESGAGKSTLMDILIGLQTPAAGSISIDGHVIDDSNRSSWNELSGYVSQAPYIYDATLAENIAFGLEGAEIDTARVAEVCAMAAVDEFLADLPNGYDTGLGERGIRLSGGQQQRICIARALYHKPEVLVFDEATSSLDAKSEQQIQQSILALKGKVTMVIVAHRLSTVESCDRILWLEDGKIRRFGPPQEILAEYRVVLQSHNPGE